MKGACGLLISIALGCQTVQPAAAPAHAQQTASEADSDEPLNLFERQEVDSSGLPKRYMECLAGTAEGCSTIALRDIEIVGERSLSALKYLAALCYRDRNKAKPWSCVTLKIAIEPLVKRQEHIQWLHLALILVSDAIPGSQDAGEMWLQLGDIYKENGQTRRALSIWGPACLLGWNVEACGRAGSECADIGDNASALTWYTHGCHSQDGMACLGAEIVSAKSDAPGFRRKATEIFSSSCRTGDEFSCRMLEQMQLGKI